jgi:protease-4
MSLDPDLLIDRRRLKRRLTFWRVAAILAVALAVFIGFSINREAGPLVGFRPHIARVTLNGFIGTSRERTEMLAKLKDDDNVSAVLVDIDSPGGSTSGGEELYDGLRALAQKKPVAAVFGTAATSAAYLAGIATDYIVAHGNTITGSVGVIFQWAQIGSLLDKLGVKVEEVRSGPLKANPSLFEPADEQARQLTQDLVHEAEGWFSGIVAERRPATAPTMNEIRTGRIYTGRQAIKIGLIDAIGDEKTAIAWFEKSRGVEKDLAIVDWKPESSGGSRFWRAAVTHIAQAAGFSTLDSTILSEVNPLGDRSLDGLLSIWHPQLGK